MSKVPGVTSFDGIPPDGATCSNNGQTATPLCAGLPTAHHTPTEGLPSTHHSITPPLHRSTTPPLHVPLPLNTQGITMSVKALDLILKLTEELRGAKHAENSEGRAFYPESFSGPRVRSLNPALCPGGTAVSVCGCSTLNQER
jgi:hypothetical protein